MKPISLKLRGALGIRDGLDLEEIELDLTCFSPGLICIVGPNGSGKTTLMDNLHPFLELPSRTGSLANHFFLRDSMREFVFALGGRTYRSCVLIDAQTRKTEAYLYQGDTVMNDGRISSYNAKVEQLVGSSALFFKSIFAAQGASGITRMTSAERKELFFELLDLQIYEAYVQYAGGKIAEMEKEYAASRAVAERGRKELDERAHVESELAFSKKEMENLTSLLAMKTVAVKEIEARVRGIQRELEEQNRRRQEHAQLKTEIAALEKKLDQASAHHASEIKELTDKQTEGQREITRLRGILGRSVEIRSHVEHLCKLRLRQDELAQMEKEFIAWQQRESERKLKIQQQLHQRTMELGGLKQEEAKLLSEAQRLRSAAERETALVSRRLADVRAVAAPVNAVPCREREGLFTACTLLLNARKALDDIPALEEKLRSLESQEYYESIGGGEVNAKLSALRETQRRLTESVTVDESLTKQGTSLPPVGYDTTIHQEVRDRIKKLEADHWEQLAVELQVAGSVLKEKENQQQSLSAQRIERETRGNILLGEIKAQIAEKRDRCREAEDSRDYARLAEQCSRELKEAERSLVELRKQELGLHACIASAEATLQRLEKLQEEVSGNEANIRTLMKSLEEWKFFQRACSKEGIPALELDAAGPAVSRIANDLLASSFGVRFQIAFETTRLSKDGKKQLETFDIRIMGEAGEKHIEDLSGGEQVWIERAISEAIAIYLSRKSGKEYLTTFQDESDGALDPENKQNYLRMLQESFRLGRRAFTFVITQSPEIWQQVEQRIHLSRESSMELVY